MKICKKCLDSLFKPVTGKRLSGKILRIKVLSLSGETLLIWPDHGPHCELALRFLKESCKKVEQEIKK